MAKFYIASLEQAQCTLLFMWLGRATWECSLSLHAHTEVDAHYMWVKVESEPLFVAIWTGGFQAISMNRRLPSYVLVLITAKAKVDLLKSVHEGCYWRKVLRSKISSHSISSWGFISRSIGSGASSLGGTLFSTLRGSWPWCLQPIPSEACCKCWWLSGNSIRGYR